MAIDLAALDAQFGGNAVVRFLVHDYDQSIELFMAPQLAAGWLPTEAQLKAVSKLGFTTVYCNFADDTEFIGGWKHRIIDAKKVPNGEYWVQSPRRDRVGYPRYRA